MNNPFFKNLNVFIDSVYLAWFMTLSCISSLLHSQVSTVQIIFAVVGLILFAPTLYRYHISKTINEFGISLNDTSK